eukprot:TRINITY_DN4053_c0_g1_i2.p2 TRINITY_DN4053_c0_g1~~TRINITY_DN4053_c0_g1_i2.p2  ORF type:complete len:321 (-),score=44.13 TRINITY_DN4053_c0_g1_i2:139-1101(-)
MHACPLFLCLAAGDPLQVVPVKVTDTSVDGMVFNCPAWRSTFAGAAGKVACLTGFHRQSNGGIFQSLLDRVRWGRAGDSAIGLVNGTWSNTFKSPIIKMRILKSAVLSINESKLRTIESPVRIFTGHDVVVSGDATVVEEAVSALCSCVDLSLSLKQSAFVILTRKVDGVAPGTRGTVTEFKHRSVAAGCELLEEDVVVACDFNGKLVEVSRMRFSAYNSAGVEVAYCELIPLILGWAVTVHRVQGLTLDAVEIDFKLDTWTTCGLVYTALSRVRSFSCLRVRGLRRSHIRVSRCAVAFYESKLVECGTDPRDDGRPTAA